MANNTDDISDETTNEDIKAPEQAEEIKQGTDSVAPEADAAAEPVEPTEEADATPEEVKPSIAVPEVKNKPKATPANQIPDDILEGKFAEDKDYEETDVFAWANNLVQYKDELKVDLYLFNRNYVVYRTARSKDLDKQMEPIFVDEMLEYILEGVEKGLIVRGFEDAEAEENVLQRTRVSKVDKLREVLGWLKTQEHEIELFVEEEHDMKRVKGIIARVSYPASASQNDNGDVKRQQKPFYIIKALPQTQVMKGKTGWMLRDNKMVPFDADAALRIPTDNQLLVLDQDIYVFNQAKLKSLFGYDAKESWVAEQKVKEIEENFRLSFADGLSMQSLVKGKQATIKKLQKVEPANMKQEDMMDHSDEMGVGLMQDDDGSIIIMDDKDLTRFVNLLNDDYMESPLTGIRYEIKSKRELKPADEEELLKQVL